MPPPSSNPGAPLAFLFEQVLAADGTFDVANISQAYDDLVMMLIVRGTRAATADFLQWRANNDSGATQYDGAWQSGGGLANSFAASSARLSGAMPAASATSGDFAMYELLIPGYTSTAWRKTILALTAGPVTDGSILYTETGSGLWKSTAAINRVQFFGGTTTNLLAGSTLRGYGRGRT